MSKALPNLTLEDSRVSPKSYAWDLSYIVYEKGTDLYPSDYSRTVDRSGLGKVKWERLPLAMEIFEDFQGQLVAGNSPAGVRTELKKVWQFYRWANTAGRAVTLATLRKDYLDWCEHQMKQLELKKITINAVVGAATTVGKILGRALGSRGNLIRETRLPSRVPPRGKTNGDLYERNLSETQRMGSLLYDLSLALGEDAIRGPLPLKIPIRGGKVLEEWCSLTPDAQLSGRRRKDHIDKQRALRADEDWAQRIPLVNLRIEAEFLIFIGCADMNLAQVRTLKSGSFIYSSYFSGYEVRRLYKGRRKGEVEFRIYKEYREIFDRYLAWRDIFFPDDDRLFPRIGKTGRLEPTHIQFSAIRGRCKSLDIPFVPPRLLRGTATNWHLRRTKDPGIVANIAQHSEETLGQVYEIPDRKLAAVEISEYHSLTDPAMASAGPGQCKTKKAAPLSGIPPEAPQPDCISPAGCLFCKQNRDIGSLDHIWSLFSFRYLKSIELSKFRPAKGKQLLHPAQLVLSRVSAKLDAIRVRDATHAQWIEEASRRIEEGWYHPAWEGFIKLSEVYK